VVTETKKPKKPYRKPVVRSEKILVLNFFSSGGGQGCEPLCPFDPSKDA
jgi:hypothetical protein